MQSAIMQAGVIIKYDINLTTTIYILNIIAITTNIIWGTIAFKPVFDASKGHQTLLYLS